MAYDLGDAVEAMLGSWSTLLFFFALRSGDKFYINPATSIFMTFTWLLLIYLSASKLSKLKNREIATHVFFDFLLTLFLAVCFAFLFGFDLKLNLVGIFSSPAIVATWIALPYAVLFDLGGIKNVFQRFEVERYEEE